MVTIALAECVHEVAAHRPTAQHLPGPRFALIGHRRWSMPPHQPRAPCGRAQGHQLGRQRRYLPECEFRGRNDHRKSHYALSAAAVIRGGVEPDLLGEVVWWATDDLWLFSLYALVAYLRIAAERTGLPMSTLCERIAQRQGAQLSPERT